MYLVCLICTTKQSVKMSVHFRGAHVPDYYFDKFRKDRLAVPTCLPLFFFFFFKKYFGKETIK